MRKIPIAFALFWPILTLAEPVALYQVTSLVRDQNTLFLLGGKRVQLKTPLTKKHQIIFLDLNPSANWGHPALLRVLRPNNEIEEEIPVFLPPEDLESAPRISRLLPRGGFELRAEKDLASLLDPSPPVFQIDSLNGKLQVKDPSRYYALLVNGRAFSRHWNDASFLYRVLTRVYGYSPKHIYILDSKNKDSAPDLDGDGSADILYGSTKGDLKTNLQQLASVLRAEDQLLFITNDHGIVEGSQSKLVLLDGMISSAELSELLRPIRGTVLSVFEQCFSGGFVRPSLKRSRVSLAASTDQELSWSTNDLRFDEFLYRLIEAFAFQTHEGGALSADSNGDGKVSAKEAFGFAVSHDVREESPAMEAWANSGDGDRIGFGDVKIASPSATVRLPFSRTPFDDQTSSF